MAYWWIIRTPILLAILVSFPLYLPQFVLNFNLFSDCIYSHSHRLTLYVLTDLWFLLNSVNFPLLSCVPDNSQLGILPPSFESNQWNIALVDTILEMTSNDYIVRVERSVMTLLVGFLICVPVVIFEWEVRKFQVPSHLWHIVWITS